MQQEGKEAVIAEKMERMKKENQRRRERYAEVEADRQNADHFSSQAFFNPTNFSTNSQPKYNNRNRRSDQFFGITKKYPHQRLPLADGPPPDPSFNFLSDPSRFEDLQSETSPGFGRDMKHERGGGDSGYKKQDYNSGWHSRQDHMHKPNEGFRNDRGDFRGSERGHRSRRPYHFGGGGVFHDGQQINSSESQGSSINYRGRGFRSRGQYNTDNHGTRGNRYERRNEHWTQERSHYDEERIKRSQTQDGRWRREWDADKMYHDNQRGQNHSHRGRQGHNYKGPNEHYTQSQPGYDYDRAINSAASSGERTVSMKDTSDNLLISIQNQAPVPGGPRRGSHDRPFRGHNRSTDDYRRHDQKFDSPRGNNTYRPRSRRPRGNYRDNNERGGNRSFGGHASAQLADNKLDQPEVYRETHQWSQSASAHDGSANWDECNDEASKEVTGEPEHCQDALQNRGNSGTNQNDVSSPKIEDCSETNTLDSRDEEDWEDVPTSGNDSGELVANLSGSTDHSNKEEPQVSDLSCKVINSEDVVAGQTINSVENTILHGEEPEISKNVDLRTSPVHEEEDSKPPKAEEADQSHQDLAEGEQTSESTNPDSSKSESCVALSNSLVESRESEGSGVQMLPDSNINDLNDLTTKLGDTLVSAVAIPATADSIEETEKADEGLSQVSPDASTT